MLKPHISSTAGDNNQLGPLVTKITQSVQSWSLDTSGDDFEEAQIEDISSSVIS